MIPGPRGVWTKKPVRAAEAAGMARDGILLTCCLDRFFWGGVTTIAHLLKSTSCSDCGRQPTSEYTLFFPFRGPKIGAHHTITHPNPSNMK